MRVLATLVELGRQLGLAPVGEHAFDLTGQHPVQGKLREAVRSKKTDIKNFVAGFRRAAGDLALGERENPVTLSTRPIISSPLKPGPTPGIGSITSTGAPFSKLSSNPAPA